MPGGNPLAGASRSLSIHEGSYGAWGQAFQSEHGSRRAESSVCAGHSAPGVRNFTYIEGDQSSNPRVRSVCRRDWTARQASTEVSDPSSAFLSSGNRR